MGRTLLVTEVKEGKLDEYRQHHDHIWPEVAAGLRTAGLRQLTIFNVPGSRRLCMYIEVAGNVDLGRATGPGSTYRQNPRCKEWEEMMDDGFHGGWTACEEMHASDIEWNFAFQRPATCGKAAAAAEPIAEGAASKLFSSVRPAAGRRASLGEAPADLRRRRRCMVAEVKEGKLEEYKDYHDSIRPEAVAGMRGAGIKQLLLFLVPGTRRLVMYIDVAGDVDLAAAINRCSEGESIFPAFRGGFHDGWTECTEIHASDIEWNWALQLPAVENAEAAPGKSALDPAPPDTWQLLCTPATQGGAGLAEYLRVIFEEAGASYQEVTEDLAEFFSGRQGAGLTPLIAPPAIRKGASFALCQAPVCAKYLAVEFGLYPKDPKQAIVADQIVATVHAFHMEKREAAVVKKYMTHFETLLKANGEGDGFFVGDDLTHADLQVMVMLQATSTLWPEAFAALPLPRLKAFLARMEARPRISEYLASPRRHAFARV